MFLPGTVTSSTDLDPCPKTPGVQSWLSYSLCYCRLRVAMGRDPISELHLSLGMSEMAFRCCFLGSQHGNPPDMTSRHRERLQTCYFAKGSKRRVTTRNALKRDGRRGLWKRSILDFLSICISVRVSFGVPSRCSGWMIFARPEMLLFLLPPLLSWIWFLPLRQGGK